MPQMPTEIAEVYDLLSKEVTWIHGRWICYRQLFAESERRIDMLNECASAFFFIIQDALLGEIQVSISKLTDPAKTGINENLSLEQLQVRLELQADQALAQKNRATLDSLKSKATSFRTWRNKQLAHLDLSTALKTSTHPLPDVTQEMLAQALGLIRDYLNAIEQHYNNSEIGYEDFIMSSDGDSLLGVIRYGLRYEQLLEEGKVPYDDWRHSEWYGA